MHVSPLLKHLVICFGYIRNICHFLHSYPINTDFTFFNYFVFLKDYFKDKLEHIKHAGYFSQAFIMHSDRHYTRVCIKYK